MKTKILILFLALAPVMTQAQVNYAVSGNTAYVTYSANAIGNVVITNTYDGYPVTSIGEEAFQEGGLTNVTIGNSVTYIGEYAFVGCFSLTSVTIGNSVTSIGDDAFNDCQSLTSVTVGNGVTSIGVGAFAFCHVLTSVTIGNSVTSIGEDAFELCSGLTSVTIPASVTRIGDGAFESCLGLHQAYFQGNAPLVDGAAGSADSTVFQGDSGTVYYLPGATGWGSAFGGWPTVLWNPQANTFSFTGGQFGFKLTGPTNAVIVVEACTNLSHPVWLPVSTNTLSGLGASAFSDPQSGGYPMRYYRFRSP